MRTAIRTPGGAAGLVAAATGAAVLLFVPSPAGGAPPDGGEAAAVARVLDDWHDAAAKADEARYFGHFAEDAVFLGTDPDERWTAAAFRVWAKPYFARGRAWSFRARGRSVALPADGKTAWFDETLDTPNLGVCRGSGVLVKAGGTWKIAQYNLSISIPNDLAASFVKAIGEYRPKPATPPPTSAPSPTPAPTALRR